MKQSDLIVLGLAGVAVWLIWQTQRNRTTSGTATRPSTGSGAGSNWVGEIFDAAGLPFDNGWRYYDNGTAIDPDGNYYFQGQKVYSATAGGATGAW